MRRSLLTTLRDERGITLVELMVGSVLALLTLAMLGTWISTTSRIEIDQEADLDAMAALREAKTQVQRELRFADGVLPSSGPKAVDIWLDLDSTGGGAPDASGEHVTWALVGDELLRYVDGDPSTARVVLRNVDLAASDLELAGGLAEIEFVVEVDQGSVTARRSIRTRVTLRNT